MGDRGRVADRRNLEPRTGERTDGGLAAGTRTLYVYVDAPQSKIMCLPSRRCRRNLRSIRRVFPAPFEAHFSGACPRYCVAVLVGERDDHVVKRGLDVRLTIRLDNDVLFADRSAAPLLPFRHVCSRNAFDRTCTVFGGHASALTFYLRGAFFLPATVRRRPFLVRAFVRVRCPLTGSPRR